MQYEQPALLPQPDPLSAEHSSKVSAHIRDKIERAGGYISFAEYMHEALYAPGLGYYNAGTTKFGADGDFVTAPEVSSVFGQVLARQVAEVLGDIGSGAILEFGAGSGKLAVDLLTALEKLNVLPTAYQILEVSPDLQQRQQQRLQAEVPHLAERVEWLAGLPQEFTGVIVANEVLDALPADRFVRRGAEIAQLGVTTAGETFVWSEVAAPSRIVDAVTNVEAELGEMLSDGYTSEYSSAVPQWVGELANSLTLGAAFLFDYGVSQREYYAPDRNHGWLRCHFRHHAHNDPLLYPGIQDLTTWVDFSAVAGAAVANGLDLLGYQTQAQFLMGGGLETLMHGFAELPVTDQLKLSGQIKTLTLPGEMGESFKCMALGRGEINTPSAFRFSDRTQTL